MPGIRVLTGCAILLSVAGSAAAATACTSTRIGILPETRDLIGVLGQPLTLRLRILDNCGGLVIAGPGTSVRANAGRTGPGVPLMFAGSIWQGTVIPETNTLIVTAVVAAPNARFIADQVILPVRLLSPGIELLEPAAGPVFGGNPVIFAGSPVTFKVKVTNQAGLPYEPPNPAVEARIADRVFPLQHIGSGVWTGTFALDLTLNTEQRVVFQASSFTLQATFMVLAPAALAVSRSGIETQVSAGAQSPQVIPISVTSGNTSVPVSVSVTSDTGGAWLLASLDRTSTPATLSVNLDPGKLSPGLYSGTVEVASARSNPRSLAIGVRLEVRSVAASEISVDTAVINASAAAGAEPVNSLINVLNKGEAQITFTASAESPWLSVAPQSGTVTSTRPAAVVVTLDPKALASDTYRSAIVITSANGQQTRVPVNFAVGAAKPVLVLSQTALAFTAVSKGGDPLPDAIAILNAGSSVLTWRAEVETRSGEEGWLRVSQNEGRVVRPFLDTSAITVSVRADKLPEGEYTGLIRISSPDADNSPQTVTVTVQVLPPGSDPGPQIRPSAVVLISAGGANPPAQTVSIASPGREEKDVRTQQLTRDPKPWFTHFLSSREIPVQAPATLTVQPDFAGLSSGIRFGSITLLLERTVRNIAVLSVVAPAGASTPKNERSQSGCTPQTMKVQLTSPVADGQQILTLATGRPASFAVRIVTNCGDLQPGRSTAVRFRVSGETADNMDHVGGGMWTKSWQAKGRGRVIVSVRAVTPTSPTSFVADGADVEVALSGATSAPLVDPGGVKHGASFQQDVPVAPGELISVFGDKLASRRESAPGVPLPTRLADAEVLLGGRSLPIVFASERQMNVQIPHDVPLNSRQQLVLQRADASSSSETLLVVPAQPAVFTKDQSGSGEGVIVHGVSNALVSADSPAAPGETVVIYCTGLGAVTPAVPAGQASPVAARTVVPVSVTIGGRSAEVAYAGVTPGSVGLYQVNAIVPEGIAPGAAVVTVSAAGAQSPEVTMAVR
jgi:uncharacterized protein (TIGR03437 family)